MNKPNPLPRRDLRENAFRRYEMYIYRATKARELYINPKADMDLSPATFKARFDDAILGKKKFNYKSTLIPESYDLSKLRSFELEDGRVLIQNETESIESQPISQITEELVVAMMKRVANKEVQDSTLPCTPDELIKVLAIAERHPDIDCIVVEQKGNAFFYTV